MNSNSKVQYICFLPDQDFWNPIRKKFLEKDNVIVCKKIKGPISNFFHKIHYSMRINTKIRLPFKKIWYKKYLNYNRIKTNSKKIFLFIEGTNIAYDYKFLEFLKNQYINVKFVYYFVNTIPTQEKKSVPNLKNIKKNYDLVVTFDYDDAKEYGLKYNNGMYAEIENKEEIKIKKDVLFVGKNKGRVDQLHSIYERLVQNGIKCDFNITDVPKDKQIFLGDINYNRYISYEDVVKKIKQSRCILELIFNNRFNFTLRTREAIIYNKKLITNNKRIKEKSFYKEKYINVFKSSSDIDVEFVLRDQNVNYANYQEEFSPMNFLEFLSRNL
ncbi:hypothetical protein [Halanaerobium congolense]|uniref:Uncharacterized protein n=1 Tax=Halanaerobium congolense TaxID=54121 RepID=A0A4R7E573_9FIRM|nr:hypothetical protein [Halanaerobium congolense]TDS28052.1 hypothetical protein BY453_12330 [Halanaerobium congolense]SDH60246.1 hypothetical protein SAMN04515651_11815 [Halanaerobium congolense]